jgi:Recombinase
MRCVIYLRVSTKEQVAHRGLCNRGRRDRNAGPIGVSALASILANKAYAGIVAWDGIEDAGLHEPLTDTATFDRVQDLLAARSHGAPESVATTTT